MGQLTESARQFLVSQGIVVGVISVLVSLGLLLTGTVVIVRANDILHFTSLIHLAVLQLVCGLSTVMIIAFVLWTIVGYRNRQLEIRSKYLDDNLTKGLIALFIPAFVNYTALLVSVAFLIVKTETTSRHEMKNAVSLYASDMKQKVFVDRLQITLRCCGSRSVADWFMIDWQGDDVLPGNNTNSMTSFYWDSVPFSCCRPEAPPPCVHQGLRTNGMSSLFKTGCAEKLDKAVLIYVITSIFMFLISSLSMSLLMFISRKLQTSARSAIDKGDATAPGRWWIISQQFSADDYRRKEELPLLCQCDTNSQESPNIRPQTVAQVSLHNRCTEHSDTPLQKSKIIDSTVNDDWASYNSSSMQPEIDSSEDWRGNYTSQSMSESSESTGSSMICNYTSDSRRSASDTAVASLEVSHHLEHKIRPPYRR